MDGFFGGNEHPPWMAFSRTLFILFFYGQNGRLAFSPSGRHNATQFCGCALRVPVSRDATVQKQKVQEGDLFYMNHMNDPAYSNEIKFCGAPDKPLCRLGVVHITCCAAKGCARRPYGRRAHHAGRALGDCKILSDTVKTGILYAILLNTHTHTR